MEFQFDPDDHDHSDKEFLGETGDWNGEDVVEIIVRQRVTAEFICRRLYQFFVADDADEIRSNVCRTSLKRATARSGPY